MKAKNKDALNDLRSLSSAIKQFEVDNRVDVIDSDIMFIITKQLKQSKDCILWFEDAHRDDLVAIEESQLAVI